jgi:hypothetical protein
MRAENLLLLFCLVRCPVFGERCGWRYFEGYVWGGIGASFRACMFYWSFSSKKVGSLSPVWVSRKRRAVLGDWYAEERRDKRFGSKLSDLPRYVREPLELRILLILELGCVSKTYTPLGCVSLGRSSATGSKSRIAVTAYFCQLCSMFCLLHGFICAFPSGSNCCYHFRGTISCFNLLHNSNLQLNGGSSIFRYLMSCCYLCF